MYSKEFNGMPYWISLKLPFHLHNLKADAPDAYRVVVIAKPRAREIGFGNLTEVIWYSDCAFLCRVEEPF